MIANVTSNINLHPVVTDLFIRGKKLSICLVFISVISPCTKGKLLSNKFQQIAMFIYLTFTLKTF